MKIQRICSQLLVVCPSFTFAVHTIRYNSLMPVPQPTWLDDNLFFVSLIRVFSFTFSFLIVVAVNKGNTNGVLRNPIVLNGH